MERTQVMNTTYRWGILGLGSIAQKFAAALQEAPHAQLVGVASRDLQKARSFATEFGAINAFGSYEELAQAPDIDIVYIATPHTFHCAHSLLCLNAGKAVLCEKPLCRNEAEAQTVIATARAKNLFYMEAMWTRFFPLMQRVQELIRDRVIGEIRMLTADFGFPCPHDPRHRLFNAELAGGSLLDVGVYALSFFNFLWGEPDAISGTALIGKTGVDEQAAWISRYSGGRIACGSCAIQTATPQEAQLLGTQGWLRIHAPWWRPSVLTIHRNDTGPQELHLPFQGNGYQYEAEAAMECLQRAQIEHPIMSHAASLAVLRDMDALRTQWGLKYPGEA